MTTTLAIEDRRSWERELLSRYLGKMRELCGLRTDPESAWNAYRQQTLPALLMWTPTLCPPPHSPDMQPREMSIEMIKRITTAMSDLEALDSL